MNSGKTAIARKTVSAPTKYLVDNNLLHGTVLHYGEGKALLDTVAMSQMPEVMSVTAYDPNSADEWKRVMPQGVFNGVVMNYVLNVLRPDARKAALLNAIGRGFTTFITVRLDKVDGTPYRDGVVTSRGTFQTQLTAEQWIVWLHNVMTGLKMLYKINIIHKTRNYLMIEVY